MGGGGLLSSDELDLCNFPDFLLQQVQEVSVPLMTLLCEMCILTPIKVLSLGQQMVPTHTHFHPHVQRRRSGHGNRPIMAGLVCSGITRPNLLSSTSVYLI